MHTTFEGYATVISIHAPVKGATSASLIIPKDNKNFNPRTREGCDPRAFDHPARSRYFNPRTREGCDMVVDNQGSPTSYFNPRTREGCDWKSREKKGTTTISIHAPVKGATS